MREHDTALIDACRNGRLDAVKALLARGADANEPKTDGSGATPLYIAAQEGHTEVVWALRAAGADVDRWSWSRSGPRRLQLLLFNDKNHARDERFA